MGRVGIRLQPDILHRGEYRAVEAAENARIDIRRDDDEQPRSQYREYHADGVDEHAALGAPVPEDDGGLRLLVFEEADGLRHRDDEREREQAEAQRRGDDAGRCKLLRERQPEREGGERKERYYELDKPSGAGGLGSPYVFVVFHNSIIPPLSRYCNRRVIDQCKIRVKNMSGH